MIKLNPEAAIKQSLELAKVIYESQGHTISIDADGANALADFIEILENRLTGQDK